MTQSHPAGTGHGHDGAVVLKAGSLFLLSDKAGDVPAERPHAFGLYLHDVRYLDVYTLRINGVAPTGTSPFLAVD